MNTFFPHMAVDQKPLSPSKAERATSWVAGLAVMPAVALQMIGAIPLHAVRDSRLGAIGGTVDSIFELFHGFVSAAAPKVASWAGALPPAAVHAVLFFRVDAVRWFVCRECFVGHASRAKELRAPYG